MSRGVLYVAWPGHPRTEAMLARSVESLGRTNPDLPHRVARLPAGSTLLDKSRMADLTPFDVTLFLDTDTVVLGPLDFAMDRAERFGLCAAICECPWARRYPSLSGDAIEYNTGVLGFTASARPVFDRWGELNPAIDSSILFYGAGKLARMPHNDQAGFALAVEQTGFNPFVLPINWNFRPLWHKSWFGPIRIWHDYSDPPRGILDFTASQDDPESVIRYAERA